MKHRSSYGICMSGALSIQWSWGSGDLAAFPTQVKTESRIVWPWQDLGRFTLKEMHRFYMPSLIICCHFAYQLLGEMDHCCSLESLLQLATTVHLIQNSTQHPLFYPLALDWWIRTYSWMNNFHPWQHLQSSMKLPKYINVVMEQQTGSDPSRQGCPCARLYYLKFILLMTRILTSNSEG